jgi:hypothetical protein
MNKKEWKHVKNIFKRIKKLLKKSYIITIPVNEPNKIQFIEKEKHLIKIWFSDEENDCINVSKKNLYKDIINDVQKFKIERIKVCKHIQKGLTK